jgi:hypothetical protein
MLFPPSVAMIVWSLPSWLAAWTPNVLFVTIAMLLVRLTPDTA